MKPIKRNPEIHQDSTLSSLLLALLILSGLAASGATIDFKSPVTCAGDTDVQALGQPVYSYDYGAAATVNGVAFSQSASFTLMGGGNITLSTFNSYSANTFAGTNAPYTSLTAAYKNLLVGGVYVTNGGFGTVGTVTLNGLNAGHLYALQLWADDSRGQFTNRNEYVYDGSGGATNLLVYDLSRTNGGLGQFIIGNFTADGSSQNFLLDSGPTNNLPQMNALQLRDMSSVWSGTTSGNWANSDTTSANFSGLNYATVAGLGLTNVYFADTDAYGNAVATSTVTVGVGGASSLNVVFQNLALAYTLNSADANGITGPVNVTLNGTNTVTLTGANTYTGSTVLGSNARLAIGAAGSIANSVSVSLGTSASLTVSNSSVLATIPSITLGAGSILDASATSLPLASGQTLTGFNGAVVKGNVIANNGSVIALGNVGVPATLTFNNNLTLSAQTNVFDLGYGPNSSADKLIVNGALTLNGNAIISLNYLGGALYGGTYTLMTFGSLSGGTFALDHTYPGVTLNVNATSVTLTVAGISGGTSGVWTNLANGTWANGANWLNGIVATNVDALADFSTLTMPAAIIVTNSSTNITVGNLIFGDLGQTYNWTLSGGTNTLAVSVGSPRIVANPGQNTTISSSLRGTQGFTKDGTGTLTLSGNNLLSGTINVNHGTLAVSSLGGIGGTTNSTVVPLTISNATVSLSANNYTNNIILAPGTTNTLSWGSTKYLMGTAGQPLNGSGVVLVNVGGGTPYLNGGANHNFTGSLICTATSGGILFEFNGITPAPHLGTAGSSNAVYELDGSASSLYYMAVGDWNALGTGGCTNYLGELRGTGTLYANNGRSGTTTLEIGGLNTSPTFSGAIKDNKSSVPASVTPMVVRKVGTGTLTLSGTSTYTGATDIRAGRLILSGTLVSNTPISVATGAAFELSGTINSTTVNIQNGGALVLDSGANLNSAAMTLNGLMDTTPSGGSFDIGSATLSGSGVVTGALTLSSSAINPGAIGAAGTLTITNGSFTSTLLRFLLQFRQDRI